MRIRNAFEEIFCLRSDISNHDIILPKGQIRKRVWILEYRLDIFWSVIGSGFGEPGGIPPPGIPRRTPPPPGEPTENHMPVSLLCAVCKVLERLNTIRSNNSNVHSSMVFLQNRSCTTQLLSVFNLAGQNQDKNIQSDVIPPALC